MDYTILYIIAFVILVVGLFYLVNYLQKKNLITQQGIDMVKNVLGLTTAVIDELNLKNEDKVLQIGTIIIQSLDYVSKEINTTSKAEQIAIAENYAYELCEKANISLTENRKLIINSLVEIGYRNRFGELVG